MLRLVPELQGRGWRFAFWAPRPSPLFDLLRERSFDVDGAPRRLAYSIRALKLPPGARERLTSIPAYLRGFRRRLRDVSPAIVHANSLTTLPEAMLSHLAGVPTVFHVHEMLPPTLKGSLARRVIRAGVDEVLAVSDACADSLAIGRSRPRVVHECTPIPPPPVRDPRDDGRMIVGTVGVLSRRKGSDLFVEAARLVRGRAPAIEFRMIGAPTDPLDESFARQVMAKAGGVGIAHQLRGDVPAALREWDLFVLPSRRDPFPISLLEAMAAGLPVVGTRVDGIPEQVTPETGVLCQSESPGDLAEAIIGLYREPLRRIEMGRAGRRRVEENFHLERQVEGVDAAYRAALARRRAAASS